MELFAFFFKPPLGIAMPPQFLQQCQGPTWIIRHRFNPMVIIICLLDKGPCDSLPLAIEHIVHDFVYINGHAQGPSHSGVVKRAPSQVVPDIGIAKGCAGKTLESGIGPQAFDLVRLNTIAVDGACVEFHFLGQQIRDYTKQVAIIVGRTFPVPVKAFQGDVLIRLPLLKYKGAAPYRIAVKDAVPHRKFLRILSKLDCLFLKGLLVQEMLREDPHAPGTEGRRIKPFVNYPDGQRVDHLHRLDGFIVSNAWREISRIYDGFIGELDIMGIKDVAVMKLHIRTEVKYQHRVMLSSREELSGI